MTVSSFPCPISFCVYDGYRAGGLQGFLPALGGKEAPCVCFVQEYIPRMRSIRVKATLLFLITGCTLLFLAVGCTPNAQAAALPRVAVFDFELIDNSLDGEIYGTTAAEKTRLQKLGEQLRKALQDSGRYEVADIGPVEEAARGSNLQACGGCDVDFAKKVGAGIAITGTVQKVSNVILNVNLYVRDVASGNLIKAMSVDMRGNTDESWSRAMSWLLRNRLLTSDSGQSAPATAE